MLLACSARLLALAALAAAAAVAPVAEARGEQPGRVGPASVEGAASAVPLELLGLVRSPAPGRSLAVLRRGERTRVVAEGETAFGARLVSVGRESARVEHDGRATELRLARAAAPAATPPPQPNVPLPADAPPEDPATPARDMDRRQLQIRLGEEMNRILSETALVPVIEDGRVNGVRVARIAEGSLLTDAGLRAGDVLVRINDTDIDGMATLIGLWPRLQGASELRAVVMRGGQPFSLRVTLR
jgi:general secretion pathway protein C